jgi:hypothetical protein
MSIDEVPDIPEDEPTQTLEEDQKNDEQMSGTLDNWHSCKEVHTGTDRRQMGEPTGE